MAIGLYDRGYKMKKLVSAVIAFALVIIGITTGFVIEHGNSHDKTGEYAVELNEIERLIEQGDTDTAIIRTKQMREAMRTENADNINISIIIMGSICLIFLLSVGGYCYFTVIRPFGRLTDFAERVAQGDLETPLEYERTNLFGKFTWAFDSMRKEILRARTCEREAIENNKTVIASLSHDIKTPISTVRAYAEAMEMGMSRAEDREKYVSVIIRKCDEVAQLTEDMLEHSLSDLDKLRMYPEVFELNGFLEDLLADLNTQNDIIFEKPSYTIYMNADRNRLSQAVENLITNARKYAGTNIDVHINRDENNAYITFHDSGEGVPDEDMPFIFGKFYRGKNTNGEKGSGLGLFIVKYIVCQSGGDVRVRNNNGFEVTLTLPVYEE
jgi:signal transduction histidine kinase